MKFENKNAWELLDNFLLDCSEISQDEREEIIRLTGENMELMEK